ncbi:MAG: methyltransferase domain-containing protein [Gemmatimonadaceae bacterium]
MLDLLAPRRRRGTEFLDAPDIDARVVRRSLSDVARSNTLFGGTRAVLAELAPELERMSEGGGRGRRATLLDVGTGLGDIPARARQRASRAGVSLATFGVEGNEALAQAARGAELPMMRADARRLPLGDGSVDIAMCSQLLHHFEGNDAMALLGELDRVARVRVIVSDLHRSWLAAAGLWVASFPLGFHPISRHDGVVSVLRGFTAGELKELVRAAVGAEADVRYRPGFRATASWTPTRRA